MSLMKEKIMDISLRLFAESGFEAVSIQDISSKLNITKGAIYKHYKNKQDIYDSIVKTMYDYDNKVSKEYQMPENIFNENNKGYDKVTFEYLKKFTISKYKFWTENKFAKNYRKMITIEQFKNKEANKLYHDSLCTGPVSYLKDIFTVMIKNNIISKVDPLQLAINYYSTMFLLISLNDKDKNQNNIIFLENFIDNFIENVRRKDEILIK